MVSVFLWPQWGQVRVAVGTVMQGILSLNPGGHHQSPTVTNVLKTTIDATFRDRTDRVVLPRFCHATGQRRFSLRDFVGAGRYHQTGEKAMKAFVVDRYKSKSAVRLGEMPEPEVRGDDVLVQVHAASLDQLDSKIRDGEFKLILPYRLPLILGNDVAGVVVRVGSKVRRFKPGDEVYARPHQDRIGTFAEFIAMNEADVALKPKNLTMEEAASIPLVGLTAWQVLIERANLKKGQKVLIHAGSGGVGTFAIQLAKHIGATVATTTSTGNVDLVKSLGADVVIDYKKADFEKLLSGYDVVLNSLGKDTLEKSLKVLKPGGKLISISGPPDAAFAKENGSNWLLQQVMRLLSFGIRKNAKHHGVSYSFVFMRANGEQLSKITSLIESGIIRPVVDRIFPFEATKQAWAYLETGRAKGKVVINAIR
jgi:NADPH:quinone reductase-like Zn-dependent oxidoreductase